MTLRKTKIICTIGPASWDYQTLKKLAEAGMNVVRMNMSHGTHDEKRTQIGHIRKISQELKKPIGVLIDLQGPKMRLGEIDGIMQIKKDQEIKLSKNPKETQIHIQFDISPFVQIDQRIFLNDGLIELIVTKNENGVVSAISQNDGEISSHKGVNIPDTKLKGAVFTPKDREDAIFGLEMKADYLALSFIQEPEDLQEARELIKKHHPKTQLMVKIEKNEALVNISKIIELSDAIMVARGDLAIETDASVVPIYQQMILRLCREYQKPVVIATQMLESMIHNPRPTRAEVSDVANAVLDQADAVMLSAESASGKYPVEAVQTMRNVILSVEEHPDYKHFIRMSWEHIEGEQIRLSAIVSSAASLADRIEAKFIMVPTATGRMAKLLASFRPSQQIIAATPDDQISNQLSLVWGITPLEAKQTGDFNQFLDNTIDMVKKEFSLSLGDKIVVVTGTTVGLSGSTDTIKVVSI